MKLNDMSRYRQYYVNDDAPAAGIVKDGDVKLTFLGTTTLLIDDGETQLMTDGFLSRPSLLRSAISKIETDTSVVDAILERLQVKRLRALFVAHSHYDHAFDAAHVADHTGAKLYGSSSTLNVGRGGGLREDQMALYEPGKEMTFGDFRVKILISKHSPQKKIVSNTEGEIERPLRQPARAVDYKEGGSYDILISHETRGHTILIKPGANFVDGALDDVRTDVLLLGVASLGDQDKDFRNAVYEQTVGKVLPKLVIPIHWDNFTKPLSDDLQAMPWLVDKTRIALDFLIERTLKDGIEFKILQGFQSVVLSAE